MVRFHFEWVNKEFEYSIANTECPISKGIIELSPFVRVYVFE